MSRDLQQKENQIKQILLEIRMMEGTLNTLQQRLQIVLTSLSELRIAKNSLEGLKNIEPGNHLLVPIGGATFVNAKLGEINKLIVGIGADISIEMSFDDAVVDITERLNEMDKAQESIEQQLGQIMAQLEAHKSVAERLSTEIQNTVQGSI
jgi:prefoldin alpha subunit